MPDSLIRHARDATDIAIARTLFLEYQAAIGVDLCFQNFNEEVDGLPGDYEPPHGRLLLAGTRDDPRGCVALRPLGDSLKGRENAEMKRLYVRPAARGAGLGRALAQAIIKEARDIGYREIRLDTLGDMHAARGLYADLGFREFPAYYHNPLAGTLYMQLRL